MKKIFIALIIYLMNLSAVNAAQIDSANYLGDENLKYPLIIIENSVTAAKINSEIRAEISRFISQMNQIAAEMAVTDKTISTEFEIPCNYEYGLLSVIITEYVNFEGAAHPSTFRKSLNFNSDSGIRIYADSLTELGDSDYSPKGLSRKLKAYAEKNKLKLYDDFTELERVPEDFYFDENLHVHFILQQYEVAPYAVGIIEFDATEKE